MEDGRVHPWKQILIKVVFRNYQSWVTLEVDTRLFREFVTLHASERNEVIEGLFRRLDSGDLASMVTKPRPIRGIGHIQPAISQGL